MGSRDCVSLSPGMGHVRADADLRDVPWRPRTKRGRKQLQSTVPCLRSPRAVPRHPAALWDGTNKGTKAHGDLPIWGQ